MFLTPVKALNFSAQVHFRKSFIGFGALISLELLDLSDFAGTRPKSGRTWHFLLLGYHFKAS